MNRIVLDDRERAVADALRASFPDAPVSVARLELGDVHVVSRSDDLLLVIERKTRNDLRSSLIDGRFHDQRERMVRAYGAPAIAFLVEGGTRWSEPESGAEVGLVLADGVRVLWSAGVTDTAHLLMRLCNRRIEPRAHPPPARNRVRFAAAPAYSAERSLAAMLRCVDGVSAKRADQLASRFGSMKNLAGSFERDREGAERAVADMRDAGGRRLGAALAARLGACIAGHEPGDRRSDASRDDAPVDEP